MNEGDEDEEFIEHPTDEMEEVIPYRYEEASEENTKVTFIAKEPGLYYIAFSNVHSWFRGKTLEFNYTVLTPVS